MISKSREKRAAARDKQARRGTRAHMSPWCAPIGLALCACTLALLSGGAARRYAHLAAGQKAPATVIAAVDFECQDRAATELQRQQAADAVVPVFTIGYGAYNASARAIDKLFDRLVLARKQAATQAAALTALSDAIDLLGLDAQPDRVTALAPAGAETNTARILREVLSRVWAQGIAATNERNSLFQGVATDGAIALRGVESGTDRTVSVRRLLLPEEAVRQAAREAAESLDADADEIEPLLRNWVRPNLLFDVRHTASLREEAARAVPPIVMSVRAGATLMEDREPVTPQILEMLRAHDARLHELETPRDRALKMVGDALLLTITLLCCAGWLRLADPTPLIAARPALLWALLALLSAAVMRVVFFLSISLQALPAWALEAALPTAWAPLMGAMLLGPAAAVTLGLWNGIVMSALLGFSPAALWIGALVGIATARWSRDIRKRSHLFKAGLVGGLVAAGVALGFAVVDRQTAYVTGYQALAALAGGASSALLTVLFVPVFEWAFNRTTNLTLLEWSDLSHPLMQRLALEAPGTYHHSLMVANLAQAAAREIGANELLLRVCAYYHDIGKLTKPEFFTENTALRSSPHDELAPSMSALVILSHVKEGVGLALRHKLPEAVCDGIRQHHGTGLVAYFFKRAQQLAGQQDPPAQVKEAGFRYEGPKPQTREMALLALADSVEAASRSLDKPTPSRIENLVNDIVAGKIEDSQLDQAPITLREVGIAKRAFVFALTNMMHSRIAYKAADEGTDSQSSATHSG